MAGVNEDEQIEWSALLLPPHRLGEACDDLILVDDPGVALEIGGRESPDPSQGLARWTGWQTERRIDSVGQSNDRVQIHSSRRSCSISHWTVDRPTLHSVHLPFAKLATPKSKRRDLWTRSYGDTRAKGLVQSDAALTEGVQSPSRSTSRASARLATPL